MASSTARSNAPTSALLLHASVDRLIAAGRVVLASIAFVAVALGPETPRRVFAASLLVLAVYIAGALGEFAIVMRTLRPRSAMARVELGVDTAFIAVVTLLTGGASVTIFGFFVFFVVAAGFRRSPRAVLFVGAVYFAIFLGATAASSLVVPESSLDLNRIVIRGLLLALSIAALTIFAVERERLFASLTTMVSWPFTEWGSLDDALFALLAPAADLAAGSRVALVWADPDEPWTNVALLDDELVIKRVSPDEVDALRHIDSDDSFVCARLGDTESIVTRIAATGLTTGREALMSPQLLNALSPAPRSIVGVPARGQTFSGHLLILDWSKIPSDFVLRAEILARQIASSLDIWMLSQRSRELAARDERARVWRDLHDGVLQSLTGLALMLARAEQSLDTNPAEARRILGEAATLVHDEQRDLRLSILEQKAAVSSPDANEDLATLLAELSRRFEQVWNLSVDVRVDSGISVSPALTVQVVRMIQEALSNSARHGQSSHSIVRVSAAGDDLAVAIQDNGKGFPFVGHFSHNMLIERRIGPILLKDRIQRLHGTLDIRSARTGVGLDIRIPLRTSRLAG